MASTIFEQVVEDIKYKINKGFLKPGEMIPSESSLCKEYSTTRMTIRRGLALLVDSGYIYSVPGKGSFVCEPEHDKHILHFNEKEIVNKYADRTKLIEVNIILPTKELAEKLWLKRNQKVIVIRKLSYCRKEAFAYDIKFLPYEKGRPMVEEIIEYATFPEIVATRASLFSVRNEITIFVGTAQDEEKELLGVEQGHPLMVIEQELFYDGNKPAGWGKIFYRGEYCQLRAVSTFNSGVKKAY